MKTLYWFSTVLALVVLGIASSASAQSGIGPKVGKEAIPKDIAPNVRLLIEQLYAPVPQKRGDAAKALGELGEKGALAIPFLIAMLGDEESYMDSFTIGNFRFHGFTDPARRAAVALGSMGGGAVEPLLKILKDRKELNREKAAVALGVAKDSRAVAPLIEVLAETDAGLRAEAAEALGKIKDARAVEPLIKLLKDASDEVSGKAQTALEEITGQKFGNDQTQWLQWWQKNKKQ